MFAKIFKNKSEIEDEKKWILPVVYACMNMSKSKTGALIVVQRTIPLTDYERTGDMIRADINSRLIENIFFKNSPLHDGVLAVFFLYLTIPVSLVIWDCAIVPLRVLLRQQMQ